MLKGILSTRENTLMIMMVMYGIFFAAILHHGYQKGFGSLEKVSLFLGFFLIIGAFLILKNKECESCDCEPCQPCPTIRTAPLAEEKRGVAAGTTKLAPLYDRGSKEPASTNTKMMAL